jgi:hypothetical protein
MDRRASDSADMRTARFSVQRDDFVGSVAAPGPLSIFIIHRCRRPTVDTVGGTMWSNRRRRQVQRLAAHLAHLLNEGESVVSVQPGVLYERLIRTLEQRYDGADDGPYDGLIATRLTGGDAERAAEQYINQVFRRRLYLARNEHLHQGHKLFKALCRRGLHDAWLRADVIRERGTVSKEAATASLADDVTCVLTGLAALAHGISEGNPARTTRVAFGPLYLVVAGVFTEVPEEMSIWDAISSAPGKLRRLPGKTGEFNAFCSLAIKALEAADARYSAIVALGLPPAEWEDLSLNTAKKTSAFLSDIRAAGDEKINDLAAWRLVWTRRQVPGFKSAEEFWDSELGRSLHGPQAALTFVSEIEDLEGPDALAEDMEDPEVLDPAAFEKMLAEAEHEGALTPFDSWFLRELSAGTSFEAIANAKKTREALGKGKLVSMHVMEKYCDDLQDRVGAYARSKTIHPDI